MTGRSNSTPWMDAADYGRTLTGLSLNLLVRDIERSLPFYASVLEFTCHYSDVDFAALERDGGIRVVLHADHTFDHMPMYPDLQADGRRGVGVDFNIMGIDPDQAEARARAQGSEVLVATSDFAHGWRACYLRDPDGYTFAVGVAIP